jgi:hypothetical protein
MAVAGKPLPPGGVVAVTPVSVLEHSLVELKVGVSESLKVDPDIVTIQLDFDDAGRPLPIVNVGHSPHLRQFVRQMSGAKTEEDLEAALKAHINMTLKIIYHQWLAIFKERMERINRVRKDLMPAKIVDLLHGHPDT